MMDLGAEVLRRLERLHVRAWPALETVRIEGWLWRYSGDGSQRANAVSTVEFSARSAAAALDALDRARGASARVHTFRAGSPPELAALLPAYREGEATITMSKAVGHGVGWPIDVEATGHATEEWLDVHPIGISGDRQSANRVPPPWVFILCRRYGRAISTALGVVDGGLAVGRMRRDPRGAEAVLRTLEAWAARSGARPLGPQVGTGNAPARTLYRRLGFASARQKRLLGLAAGMPRRLDALDSTTS